MAHGKAHPAEVKRMRSEVDVMTQNRSDTQVRADGVARTMVTRLVHLNDEVRKLTEERALLTVSFIEAADAAGWTAKGVANTVCELGGR